MKKLTCALLGRLPGNFAGAQIMGHAVRMQQRAQFQNQQRGEWRPVTHLNQPFNQTYQHREPAGESLAGLSILFWERGWGPGDFFGASFYE